MPDVYNWHLGRKMAYTYSEAHPKKQFAAVFNINRCIGCQTCTGACKATWTFSKGQEYMWWNNVESKPYGGYPQHWDIKILQKLDDAHKAANKSAEWDTSKPGPQAPYGAYNAGVLTTIQKYYGSHRTVSGGQNFKDSNVLQLRSYDVNSGVSVDTVRMWIDTASAKIGRASCRERVCQYV